MKSHIPTHAQLMRLSMQTGMMMFEANCVIAMRLWGMAGVWDVTSGENARMVSEKGNAMLESATAAGLAAMRGKPATAIAMAALKPVRAKTRANASRLAARGPKLP